MSELYISWSDYHKKIEQLAIKVYESGWDFNQIVCIAKGGLRIGDIFCRLFDKPLAILYAQSYAGDGNRVRGDIVFSQNLVMIEEKLGNKILLVDDLVDSGISLQKSIEWIEDRHNQEIEDIRSAVIWYKNNSSFRPDYYVDYLPDNPWIHQPFECYEQMNPEELAKKVANSP